MGSIIGALLIGLVITFLTTKKGDNKPVFPKMDVPEDMNTTREFKQDNVSVKFDSKRADINRNSSIDEKENLNQRNINKGFNLKQAIIYSSIIERPY